MTILIIAAVLMFLALSGMALKINEQPTIKHGIVTESAINTFTSLEIDVPRILEAKQLFDIDEIALDGSAPRPALGADAQAFGTVQLQISENAPTAMLPLDDPLLLAIYSRMALANATDTLVVFPDRGRRLWTTQTHANLVPDDKVWLCVMGSGNRAAQVIVGTCVIKGKLVKVTDADFSALVISRLG